MSKRYKQKKRKRWQAREMVRLIHIYELGDSVPNTPVPRWYQKRRAHLKSLPDSLYDLMRKHAGEGWRSYWDHIVNDMRLSKFIIESAKSFVATENKE